MLPIVKSLRLIAFATVLVANPLSLSAFTPSAQALQLFGVCLFGECPKAETDETRFLDPKRYELEFSVSPADEDGVEDIVKGSSQLWVGREDAVSGDAGLVARAKGDYKRILAALYNAGYYGGSISITIAGQQAAELSNAVKFQPKPPVIVLVDTGPRYTFGNAEVVNAAPPAQTYDDVVEGRIDSPFASGRTARATEIRNRGKLEIQAWRQQGFPKANVADRDAVAVHPQQQLNVTLRMDPGPRAALGELSVEGTERMDPAFVAYMTGLHPGDEFDPDDLERARKRLDRLGVFSTRRIIEADNVTAAGLLPLYVQVAEKKLRRIGLGVTASTVDGLGAQAFWLHRNLFGKAESLKLEAGIGGVGASTVVEEFDYNVGATFTKPGIFTPDTDLIANTFAKREFNDTFLETSAGGSLLIRNYVTDNLTLTGGGFANYSEVEDAFGTRQFLYVGAQGEVLYDGRNDKLDPTSGYYASLTAKPFYEFEYDNVAARFEAEGRTYLSFGEKERSVLAARLKLGSLVGAEIAETSPDLLFLAGGGNSVRGYSFKTIGLDGPNGETIAGKSLLEGSLEFRQRFNKTFGAVAFVDAGVVGKDSIVGFDQDVKIGVGLGVRYYTGLGPLRLDVAIPLDPGSDDGSFAIYAGIGQAF